MLKTTTEKRTKIEEQIKQLENQRKQLLKKEAAEKAKKQRLTNRGALIEKLLPHLATLSDSEVETYLKKVLLHETESVLTVNKRDGIFVKEDLENDEK